MSFLFSRYRNTHRSAPVREAVVVRGKNPDYCAFSHPETIAVSLNTGHLNQEIVSQADVLVLPGGRVNIQIPIVRRRL